MKNKKIILIGGGGHSKACLDVISTTDWEVQGYMDLHQTFEKEYGLDYLGTDDKALDFIDAAYFLITIGQLSSSSLRNTLYDELKQKNARFAKIISTNAIVSKKSIIAEGTIVMHGAIIQADVKIGENCIINDRSLIEHDVEIGNHCHISTGAIINGAVKIGNGVFIGSGSVIRNGITIGDNSIIGMGSVVTKNVNQGCTIYGNPAK